MKRMNKSMKIKTAVFLATVATACLAAAPMMLTNSASAEETATANITWNKEDLYVIKNVATEMPKTIEAWLQLNTNVRATAGTVFGNYGASKPFGSYSLPSSDIFNFEISEKGKPRLYLQTPDGDGESIVFHNADVRSTEFVHVSVTLDGDIAKCYLNGELCDTVSYEIEEFVSAYEYAIGGDYRTNEGAYTNYFQGDIRSVSVYSDVRTQTEIKADMTAVNAEDANLMMSYDLSGQAGAESVDDISANENDLVRSWLWDETIEQKDYAYSMVAIGDTQKANIYGKADSSGIKFEAIYDHIVANAEKDKMKFVFGLGDITDESKDWEFAKAKTSWAKLDGVVPYSFVRGNHDTIDGFTAAWGEESGSTYGKQYFASYDNTALHTAHKFTVGKLDYLVIALSWAPSDEEIAWASDIVAAHPYHNVIVTTHGFIKANGQILQYWSDKGKNYADKIWDNLIKKHENIVMVLSGHITSKRIERFTLQGDHGNTVTSLLIDPSWLDTDMQLTSPKGAGLIANLCFSEDGSKVDVNWYSPIQKKYYNSKSVYSFEINTIRKELQVSVNGEGGQLQPERTEPNGEPIKVNIVPNAGYHLVKLTLDGEDVTASVVDGVYTFTEASGKYKLVAEFAENAKEPEIKPEIPKYTVGVENVADKGAVTVNSTKTQFEKGEEVSFTVTPKSGYKVSKVTFNGTAIEQGEDGTYKATVTGTSDVLAVEYEKVSVEPIQTPAPVEKGGWGVGIGLSAAGVVLLAGAAVFVFVTKKRKN